MARIKVTAIIDTDGWEEEHIDLSHDMGLSDGGYEHFLHRLSPYLDDIEFQLEKS